jgi:alpha-D-xyloside xylohydrolase
VEAQGGWHRETHDVLSLPLYVRQNTLLPVGARDDVIEYDYADRVTLELYALGDGETATCAVSGSGPDGATLTVSARRRGQEISIEANGTARWQLLVVGAEVSAEQVTAEATARGSLLTGAPVLHLRLVTE